MTFVDNMFAASEEANKLLYKKHMDYGSRNILDAPGGALMGLAVRLHDKVARLSNLIEKGKEPNFESLRDTMLDIANYGLIGVMVLDNTFDTEKDG